MEGQNQKVDFSEVKESLVHRLPASESGEARLAAPSVHWNAIGTASQAHTHSRATIDPLPPKYT